MQYLNKLNELRLTEENVSASLRKKIAAYKKLEKSVLQFKEALDEGGVEGEDLELLTQSYNDSSDDLQKLDDELVSAIIKFDANKERYAEQSKNLKPKTKKETQTQPNQQPVTPINPAAASNQVVVEPVVEPQPPATNTNSVVEEPVVEVKKKESSGLGWLVGGLVTIALAAVGVNLLKNK